MPPKRTPVSERAARQSVSNRPSPAADALMGSEHQRREVVELPVRAIMPNRFQPRTMPSEEGLHELASSIQQYGVLEPIIVRPVPLTLYEGTGRQYELIAGERRWRACRLAAMATIPALILEGTTDDHAMLELAITENLQREDLHPLDEALALGRMQSELGYSYTQIAERLGKSKGYVQNRLRLLQLDEELQQLVRDRPDTLGHVYELARVSDRAARTELIAAVRDDALTRAATRTRVQQLLDQAAPQQTEVIQDEAHFQKYAPPGAEPTSAGGAQQPSAEDFQKYAPPETAAALTVRERNTLQAIMAKLDQCQLHGHTLHTEDRMLLERLAARLRELLEFRP